MKNCTEEIKPNENYDICKKLTKIKEGMQQEHFKNYF